MHIDAHLMQSFYFTLQFIFDNTPSCSVRSETPYQNNAIPAEEIAGSA